MVDFSRLKERLGAWANSSRGKYILKGLRALFMTSVLVYLVYRLSHIGWGELWTSLPQTPYFYVTVLVMYFTLPIAESLIYGIAWTARPRDWLPVLLRKRVLNADVLGYSGEVYLFAYARKKVNRSAREIGLIIKDNLILSSILSITTAMLLLMGLLISGYVALDAFMENPTSGYVVAAAFVFVLGIGLVARFRRSLFHLSGGLLATIAGIHAGRFLLGYVLQVVQWWVVLPDAPFSAWATLLVVFVVTNRIPLLPSRDLIFAGAGIELSASLGVPVAAVAGMLLVRSAIDRLLNLGLFAGTTLLERRHERTVDDGDVATFEASTDAEKVFVEEVPEAGE